VQALFSVSQPSFFGKGIFLGGSRISEEGLAESGSIATYLVTVDGRNGRVKTPFDFSLGSVAINFPDPGFPTLVASVNAAATGDYILLYCPRGSSGVDLAGTDFDPLYTALSQIGATNLLRSQPIGTPFLIIGRKGSAVGTATEFYGFSSPFFGGRTLTFGAPSGTMTATTIGPVKSWGSLSWQFTPSESPSVDRARLRFYGIRANGTYSKDPQTGTVDRTAFAGREQPAEAAPAFNRANGSSRHGARGGTKCERPSAKKGGRESVELGSGADC
jgi:hypothetical protein